MFAQDWISKKKKIGAYSYDKWNVKLTISSIFHFEHVNDVWISHIVCVLNVWKWCKRKKNHIKLRTIETMFSGCLLWDNWSQVRAHHLGMNFYVNFLGRLGSNVFQLKLMYSEKASKFCEISTNYLSYVLVK